MAWFEKAKEWMTPERALAFQGIGMGLSQLDAGQPVNLSPVYEALDQRKQQAAMRKMLDVPGIMDSFTPQQQAVIAAMPEGLATQVIMEHAFKAQEPVAGVNVGGNLVNPYTGEVMYAAPGEAPKPIEVGGVLLDPVTMQPIFDSRTPDVPATPMTPEERAFWGIPETDKNAYKMTGNGPVAIGGGGTSVNVDLGGNEVPGLSNLGEGYTYLYNPDGTIKIDAQGLPMSAIIPGGPADAKAQEAAAEAAAIKEKGEKKTTQGQLKLGTTLESINLNLDAIENGDLPVTGFWGDMRRTSLGRALTGDSAVDFGNRTNQITDQAALAEVQNMRDNSPTGGAVGSLTDDERRAIGNSVTALNNSTSPEEYARAAKAYRELALNIAYGEGTWEIDANGQPIMKAKTQDGGNTTSSGITWSVKP